jgi:hypothetical protein
VTLLPYLEKINILQQLIPEQRIVDIKEIIPKLKNEYSLNVFDPLVIDFSNYLSKQILRRTELNRVPVFVALAYWLRKSNMNRIVEENNYVYNIKNTSPSPLGIIFHICPSNVDTMFIYSLFVSLLTGNKNILRISSKMDDPQIDTLFELIRESLDLLQFNVLKDYILVFTYGHDKEINEYLSMKVDGRIIWGGDSTAHLNRYLLTLGLKILFLQRGNHFLLSNLQNL